MKSRRLLGVVALLAMAWPAAGELPSAHRSPDVDGRPLELVWRRGLPIAFVDRSTGAPDLGTRAWGLVSPQGVHVLFECREDLPLSLGVHSRTGDEVPDRVWLEVRTDERRLHFGLDVEGRTDARTSAGREPPSLSWGGAVYLEGATWWAEMTVPWSVLGLQPGDAFRWRLGRSDWVRVGSENLMRRVSVGGRQRDELFEEIRPEDAWAPPPTELAWLPEPEPALLLEKSWEPEPMRILPGGMAMAYAAIHQRTGSGPLELQVESSSDAVQAELYLVPRWRQAGSASIVAARVAGSAVRGEGDRWARELLLKSRRIPPTTAPSPEEPVTLSLIPDHAELLLLVLRARKGAEGVEGTVRLVFRAAPMGLSIPPRRFRVGSVAPVKPEVRWGIYVQHPTGRDVERMVELGITEVATNVRLLTPESREALARAGMSVTVGDPPDDLSELAPLVPTHGYGYDEPFGPGEHERCREVFRRVRKLGLRTTTAITSLESLSLLEGLLDRPILNVGLVPEALELGLAGRESYYYWQILREEPVRHRLLGGYYLWASGLGGAMPYAWSDEGRDPWDDWDWGFRDHMAVYRVGDGRVETMQLLGYEAGIRDVMAVATLEELLSEGERAVAAGTGEGDLVREVGSGRELLARIRGGLNRPYWETLEDLDMATLDRWTASVLDQIERLSASLAESTPPASLTGP